MTKLCNIYNWLAATNNEASSWLIRIISISLYQSSSDGWHHTAHNENLEWENYVVNFFICRLANECSAKLAAKKTPAPAANCQITAMAGVFEDRATWGPPFKVNKKAAQLELDGAPTLIPKPAWLYCDKAVQGVSVKLISNTGWNADSDEEAECRGGSLHECIKINS